MCYRERVGRWIRGCVFAIRQAYRTKHILKSSYLNRCGLFLWVIFMAIQSVDLKVPNGDTPRSAFTKINANFSDQTNAASRLVGTGKGQIPLAENTYKAAFNQVSELANGSASALTDFNTLELGSRRLMRGDAKNAPTTVASNAWDVQTMSSYVASYGYQLAFGHGKSGTYIRGSSSQGYNDWISIETNPANYSRTTAQGANVVIGSDGQLMRSTSSERYKNILAPLVLTDEVYQNAMSLNPIVYRSTAETDNSSYHYYSFSAEALGAFDPAFTLWRDTETVIDVDGNVTEQPLAERQAEGININALLAMGHAIAIKQGELIKGLQEQVIEQKEAIAALKQTNP